jgi:hypothetical protein
LLPCEVTVLAETDPLCGERLAALGFRRRAGRLYLVVLLPDGTPGTIAADACDIFGKRTEVVPSTALSVDGVRRLRRLVQLHGPVVASQGRQQTRPRPWKVVRHDPGVDPFHRLVWVYSSHTTELAAIRGRDRVKAAMVRAAGHEMAARWTWSVVNDPVSALVNTDSAGELGS